MLWKQIYLLIGRLQEETGGGQMLEVPLLSHHFSKGLLALKSTTINTPMTQMSLKRVINAAMIGCASTFAKGISIKN